MKQEHIEEIIEHGVKYKDFKGLVTRYNYQHTEAYYEAKFKERATPEQRKARMALLAGVKKWEF